MDEFLHIISSFPVSVFSVLLIVVVAYWLIAILGLVSADSLDIGLDGADGAVDGAIDGALDGALDGLEGGLEAGVDGLDGLDGMDAGGLDGADGLEAGDGGLDSSGVEGLAGVLLKLGLHGVPLTIVISLVTMIGWLVSYFGYFYVSGRLAGAFGLLAGVGVLLAALAAGIFITSVIIRPLRKMVRNSRGNYSAKALAGQPVTIRSGSVTPTYGQAVYAGPDGNEFIVQARSLPETTFARGDKVVILRHDPAGHYIIISEDEFRAK